MTARYDPQDRQDRPTRLAGAAAAVRAVLDADAAELVLADDAFGALATRLHQAAAVAGAELVDVLADVAGDDLAFVGRADHPAAFLSTRLPY